jgi:hypothetical protein
MDAAEPDAPRIGASDFVISITRTTRDAASLAVEYLHDLFRAYRTRAAMKVMGTPSSEKARLRARVVELVP